MEQQNTTAAAGTLLTTIEAAEVLRLHKQSLVIMRYRDQGPPFIRIGRRVRYRLEDLHAWVSEQIVRPGGAK